MPRSFWKPENLGNLKPTRKAAKLKSEIERPKRKRRTREESLARRRETLTNYVKSNCPEVAFDLDEEAYGAYGVGHFLWGGPTKDPVSGEARYKIDVADALILILHFYPRTGLRHRMLGVIQDRILHAHRDDESKVSLHWHPKLDCYTIARWPIVNAARYGFDAIEINGRAPISVGEIMEWPEVPAKLRGGYERQLQLIGIDKGGSRREAEEE